MTVPPPAKQPKPLPLVPLPGIVVAGYCIAPLMLLFGGFLTRVSAGLKFDWAITQGLIGQGLFIVGALWFTTAVILTGVRRIVDSYVRILQQGRDS